MHQVVFVLLSSRSPHAHKYQPSQSTPLTRFSNPAMGLWSYVRNRQYLDQMVESTDLPWIFKSTFGFFLTSLSFPSRSRDFPLDFRSRGFPFRDHCWALWHRRRSFHHSFASLVPNLSLTCFRPIQPPGFIQFSRDFFPTDRWRRHGHQELSRLPLHCLFRRDRWQHHPQSLLHQTQQRNQIPWAKFIKTIDNEMTSMKMTGFR